MTTQAQTRLVSFLGITDYSETTYRWQGQAPDEVRTRYVADAIAQIVRPHEVVVLGTSDAWNKHGDAILERLNQFGLRCPPDLPYLPKGESHDQLWDQFQIVKEAIRAGSDTKVVLDITHGFRSQPFFAAAAVTFVRAVDQSVGEMQVIYGGALDSIDGTITPIWDITPFVELLDWSRNLMLFLRTGRAADVATAAESLGRSLRKSWSLQGRVGAAPTIDQLGKALMRFGADLETVRTGSLMIGTPDEPASVAQLETELRRSAESLPQLIPPLADVLQRIREMVEPLSTASRLSEPDALVALRRLARLYHKMGRYAEAAATMREAWINRHACSRADCPGHHKFSDEHRAAAEAAWFKANELQAKEIGQVRNDIEHGGYNSNPMPPETIKRKILELIDRIGAEEETASA